MMTATENAPGALVAEAAASLVGTSFRLGGRDPRSGVDCVGLVSCALEMAGNTPKVPSGYGLRNVSIDRFLSEAAAAGLSPIKGKILDGDILLVRPGPAQHHLLIAEGSNAFIHAHAGLRKVVRTPGPLPWAVENHWRLASTPKDS